MIRLTEIVPPGAVERLALAACIAVCRQHHRGLLRYARRPRREARLGGRAELDDDGWNGRIDPGDGVDSGLRGGWQGAKPAPPVMYLNGVSCVVGVPRGADRPKSGTGMTPPGPTLPVWR